MIRERFYKEKEGRDPSIYLGIDGSRIPIEIFKGIFSDPNTVYTDDAMYGVQFIVTEDAKAVVLVTTDPDVYLAKEDIQSTDKWIRIGFVLGEYSSTGNLFDTVQFDVSKQHEEVLKRYYAGETGKLYVEYKETNDKGEYMWHSHGFNTEPYPDETDIRGTLRNHIHFVYYTGRHIPWTERVMEVKTNHLKLMELIYLLTKDQMEISKKSGFSDIIPAEDQNDRTHFIIAPGFGKLILEEDNSIEDFIVTRKDI
jgi:hypothetical protein